VLREFRFCCGGNFCDDDGGRFNAVKYSQDVSNGELRYFTGSEDIEIRRQLSGDIAFLPFLVTVT
jgi:hypothetical protein